MTDTIRQLIRQWIAAGDDNATIIAAVRALPPSPKASGPDTYVTYTSISVDTARFGAGAINLAGSMRRTLKAWIAASDLSQLDPTLPNPGALETIHDRLAGATGLDLSNAQAPGLLMLLATGVDPSHPPLMTQEQAMALLSIGYDIPDASDAEIDAIRAELARETRAEQAEAAIAPIRDAWNLDNAALDAWVRDGGPKPALRLNVTGGGE